MVAHARRDAPHECAGLLIGRPGQILEAVPVDNCAADTLRQYEIPPSEYLAQVKRCRRISEAQGENFAVIGSYHSHPRGGPEPSETDRTQAFGDFIIVIVGLGHEGGGMEIRAHSLVEGALVPLSLVVTGESA